MKIVQFIHKVIQTNKQTNNNTNKQTIAHTHAHTQAQVRTPPTHTHTHTEKVKFKKKQIVGKKNRRIIIETWRLEKKISLPNHIQTTLPRQYLIHRLQNLMLHQQVMGEIFSLCFVEDNATMSSIRYFENHVFCAKPN